MLVTEVYICWSALSLSNKPRKVILEQLRGVVRHDANPLAVL